MGVSLSVVIITKNEERNIDDCLATVRWADEIVVVDARSTDRTVELAKRITPHVFVRPWPGYGPQKNFGLDKATGEWALILDADERVPESLAEAIRRALAEAPRTGVVAYEIPRRNFFYGRWITGGGLYPDCQIRLFRRDAGRYDDTLVHERLEVRGPLGRLAEPLDHYSMPTIGHHVRKTVTYTTLAAQEKLKQVPSVTASSIGLHHLGTALKSYLLRKAYRDGVHGLIVALFAGMYTFVKYAKAWELLHVKRHADRV